MTGAMLPGDVTVFSSTSGPDNGLKQVQIYALSPTTTTVTEGRTTGRARCPPAGTVVDAAAVGADTVLASPPCRSAAGRWCGSLSTGDEVVSPDLHPSPPGRSYGSNQELLTARLRELGSQM